MDPFVLVDQVVAQGRLSASIAKKIRSKSKNLEDAVSRVERASGIRYPPFYVEPSLPVATTSVEYGAVGALYARVIPATLDGKLSIVVQFTAPLILFGLKGTIEAVAGHEFTHYVDLVRRFSSMRVSSDERAGTLFESEYADEERLVNPVLVFGADKRLASLIKKKFPTGLVDEKLNDKVAKGWLEKGLPTKRVAPEDNVANVSVGLIARTTFDPKVIAKLKELEERSR